MLVAEHTFRRGKVKGIYKGAWWQELLVICSSKNNRHLQQMARRLFDIVMVGGRSFFSPSLPP